jgi:hypothetical protein
LPAPFPALNATFIFILACRKRAGREWIIDYPTNHIRPFSFVFSLFLIMRNADIDSIFIVTLHYSMNKEPHLKTLPAACMLVLFLAVSFFGSEGTLLCFGKDGHVAIEFVDACNGSGLGSQLAGMESDECGPCRDVQLLSGPAYIKNDSHYTQMLPLMSSAPMSPSLPLKEYSNKNIKLPQYSPHKTLAGLHSIVLLI